MRDRPLRPGSAPADVGSRGAAVRLGGAAGREHGEHLAFVDLRDHTGIVQCVVDGSLDVRSEYVVRGRGRGPAPARRARSTRGSPPARSSSATARSRSWPRPSRRRSRSTTASRSTRRSGSATATSTCAAPACRRNLRLRATVNSALARAMDRQGFCEVETPLLWAPTPEGAREFAVPSRLHHGSFYVLPQSPQLAKQLLMVAGFDRYYQIARCMRDEDLRADRQFEFTQLDIEASFVSQDDVLAFVSDAVSDAAEAATGERPATIGRMTWAEALDRYGTDKPDLRFGMELVDLSRGLRRHRGPGLRRARA